MRVHLNGDIIPNEYQWLYDWFEIPAFSPQLMRRAVEENPEGEELTVEINSCGGSVFAGFEIYSVLRGAKCRTAAEVQSLAASAASTAMVGCDEVRLSPVAQVMIHLPTLNTAGDAHEHERSIRTLESIKESILNGYELKCRGRATREQLSEMMDAESWITAQDAVRLGLADSVLYDDEGAILPENIVNSVGSGIRTLANAAGGENPQALLARYEQAVRNGAKPAEGHPVEGAPAEEQPKDATGGSPEADNRDWKAQARLAIEKTRF